MSDLTIKAPVTLEPEEAVVALVALLNYPGAWGQHVEVAGRAVAKLRAASAEVETPKPPTEGRSAPPVAVRAKGKGRRR
jgi:hypothetical protein